MVDRVSLYRMVSYANSLKTPNPLDNIVQYKNLASRQSKILNTNTMSKETKTDMYNLKEAAKNISYSNKSSSFNGKTVSSKDDAISGTASSYSLYTKHSIEVSEIAKVQANNSIYIKEDESPKLTQGMYSFDITSGNKTSNVSFEVKDEESNKYVLTKVSNTINSSNSGVSAKVVSDDENNTFRLEISGNKTGEKNTFGINDYTGNAASVLGIDKVATVAKDAEYKVDDKEYKSESNIVRLDNGKVNLTLKGVTDGKTAVSVVDDKKAIHKTIDDFAKSINSVVDKINSSKSTSKLSRLTKELSKLSLGNRSKLGDIGISVKNNGSIKIDEEKLTYAIEQDSDSVKRAIGGYDGLAAKAIKIADKTLIGAFDTATPNINAIDFHTYANNQKQPNTIQELFSGIFINQSL
ncbi:MAG TPA: hypothetical protein DEP72_05325 [Clostridiales bacterium]|nr:MAG: hypothetical protein A2Y18_08560 [Clostridiales bacterium GWD2_32_19]HCC07563.1 hypothetical protein [Clostridiales bacterium]